MLGQTLALMGLLAASSSAVPMNDRHQHLHNRDYLRPAPQPDTYTPPAASGGDSFQIQVTNNCPDTKSFGIFEIDSSFAMSQVTNPVSIAPGSRQSISAPFHGIGMRLSATADQGADAQWGAQALFEFGYSAYSGMEGTAYDLSVMGGSDPTTGIAVYPENKACPSKVCSPGRCASNQGWTDPGQVDAGSPADTVCYQGKTNFRVVWCA